jgi:hypothetical protein
VGRRAAAALLVLSALLGAWPGPAAAGGGTLAPVKERYDPGQVATVVGYTAGPVPEEPFYAYLRTGDGLAEWYVGELVVEETGHSGYLHVRVSLSFDVPGELEPGDYEVVFCDDPCRGTPLGDLVPSPVSIGVEPARRVVREWALDDPEISNLEADAVLVGPGFQTTAGLLRAPPPPAPTATVPVATLSPPTPAPLPALDATPPVTDEMDWPVPTALVVAGAAGTALVMSRRQRALRPRAAAPALTTPVAGRG